MKRIIPLLFIFAPSFCFSEITGITTEPGGLDTQVQYNNNGLFQGDSDFTFNGTTVTIKGLSVSSFSVSGVSSLGTISGGAVSATSITDSGLTSGRVPVVGTGGLIQDDGDMTFNGSTLSVVGLSASSASIGGLTVSGTTTLGSVNATTGQFSGELSAGGSSLIVNATSGTANVPFTFNQLATGKISAKYSPRNILTNSRFGVWSNYYWPVQVGATVNVSTWSSVLRTKGYYVTCLTDNTQRLAVGKGFFVSSGDASLSNGGNAARSNQMYHMVHDLVVNSSFSFYMDGNTVPQNPGAISVCEVAPGTLVSEANPSAGPDGWYRSTSLDMVREYTSDHGPAPSKSFYALKLIKGADEAETVHWTKLSSNPDGYYGAPPEPSFVAEYSGENMVLGAWVMNESAGSVYATIYDGITETATVSISSDSQWHWIETTKTLSSTATALSAIFYVTGSSQSIAYICNPMFSRGSYLGEGNYHPIENEVIQLAGRIIPRNWESDPYGSSANSKYIKVESETAFQIPKGIKAFEFEVEGLSTSGGDHLGFLSQPGSVVSKPFFVGPYLSPPVANYLVFDYGVVGIDLDIEDTFYITAAGTGNWTVSMNINRLFY
jgi:hypothetical protein